MLQRKDFWIGVLIGFALYYAYMKYGKKGTAGP
jgi:hypothetical protein